jgi:hypothetical protein
MDGSTLSLILIPIIVMASLATWLILVAYAASHPTWKHGPAAPQDARTALPLDTRVPLPRTQTPRPRRQLAAPTPLAAPTSLAAAGHPGR